MSYWSSHDDEIKVIRTRVSEKQNHLADKTPWLSEFCDCTRNHSHRVSASINAPDVRSNTFLSSCFVSVVLVKRPLGRLCR